MVLLTVVVPNSGERYIEGFYNAASTRAPGDIGARAIVDEFERRFPGRPYTVICIGLGEGEQQPHDEGQQEPFEEGQQKRLEKRHENGPED